MNFEDFLGGTGPDGKGHTEGARSPANGSFSAPTAGVRPGKKR